MTLAQQARAVERDIFGALIGALVGLVLCRLAVFVVDINPFVLAATLLIGSWSGAFIAHIGVSHAITAIESMRSFAAAFRAIVLRTILWLLGIAAVLGVLAVLTGSYEVIGRVAATTAITALAACFLWPFLNFFDEQKNWRVGLFGTVSVIVAYMLGTPSIWELGFRPGEAALSGLTVALMMPVGLAAMHLSHSRQTRVAGFVSTLTYAITTTLFLLAIWFSDGWRESENLAQCAFIALCYGALATLTTVHAAAGDRRHWRWFGFAAAVFAAGIWSYYVWTAATLNENLIVGVTSVAVVIAHANLALLAPLRSGQQWWRYATIFATVVTAVTIDLELLWNTGPRYDISILGRVALASGILASTGTLALLILTRLNRSITPSVFHGAITAIALCCPKCGTKQTLMLGESVCQSCGLVFKIAVEDHERSVESNAASDGALRQEAQGLGPSTAP